MADPIHGDKPIVVQETPGTKAYCQCGLSATLPYCDGAHARHQTGITPHICVVEVEGKKAICQCRRTANAPWCDGAHKQPPPPMS